MSHNTVIYSYSHGIFILETFSTGKLACTYTAQNMQEVKIQYFFFFYRAKQYIHFQLTLLLWYSCKFITSKLPQTFSSHTGRWDILSQTCVKFENVSLVQFMHLVSICIPDRSYHRQFKFLLLWCDVFQTLITSLCWLNMFTWTFCNVQVNKALCIYIQMLTGHFFLDRQPEKLADTCD